MTNKIAKQQIKLYEKAKYDFMKGRFVLKIKHILKLQKLVTEYVKNLVSYSNNKEREELINRLTFSLLDEVAEALKD